MPPKSRISRQMILDAGLQIVREEGIHALNVRAAASRLHCSTQPIMYHFATMKDLKDEIYTIANTMHTDAILKVDFEQDPEPIVTISRNYIRFAVEESHLFRFLFQTDRFAKSSLRTILDHPQLAPVFAAMAEKVGLTAAEARDAFASAFFALHGIASLLANNSLNYDPQYYDRVIAGTFCGSIAFLKKGPDICQ